MPRFYNRKQLQQATDSEIEQFFSETIFEGIYSSELRSKNSDFYRGSITDIRLEGRPTKLIGQFLNVPHNSILIPEGPCAFKCRMNINILREQGNFRFNLLGSTLTSIKEITESNVTISVSDSKEQDLFEMWGVEDCFCIGYYHYDEDNKRYVVKDLRKPNFDHIPYYPGDTSKRPIQITYIDSIRGIKEEEYYLFRWKLSHRNEFNPYEIVLDFKTPPKPISPKWFIDTLFNDRHNDKSKNFGSATNFLDTLSKQLSAKDSTFVYELLQNADDYPVEGQNVDVEFHVTNNYLLFLHSGARFNVRNISGICGINEKEKVANKKTIGYKGIGFKTVFLNNHYVYLQTGDYSFRFDEGETPEKKVGGKIKRLGAPFQILPIWTTHNEVANEVNEVFDNSEDKFRVKIALRPENNDLLHKGRNCYKSLFREVFSDSNIILFTRNINSVRVFINGKEDVVCFRNNKEWIVGDYETDIKDNLRHLINKTLEKGNSRIPEKYKDFDCTKVSFACKHQGAIVKPVENATLYCYLPTKASWGLPFLMNTDMIPKGDRNDIETEVKLVDETDTNFNEELAAIAGSKLFRWIKDLLTSRKYHLGSVFSLIPDFKKCKREHRDYTPFITRFEDAFNICINTEQIVPLCRGIAPVKTVILDKTGLTTSGIMADDEFRKFACLEDYYLPHPLLRKDKDFNSFLKRYAEEEQIFDKDSLKNLVVNDDFKEWLRNQENNNKFLNFLLEEGYLEDYFDQRVFIEEESGNLYSAKELYYDIDEELKDLSAFRKHLSYLSFETRNFFKDNEKWNEIIDEKFAEYDGEDFINKTLLGNNWDETIEALKDWNTSFHFFGHLAKNRIVPEELCSLPFFNDDSFPAIVDDFNDKFVFISSEEGKETCSVSWLSTVDSQFISSHYDKATLEYFKTNAGVLDYSDEIIVHNIILSEDYLDKINESQQESLETSLTFVKFCYEHESLFGMGSLRNYVLNAYDCDGDEVFVLHENRLYFPSRCFDNYSAKQWLDHNWMYCLHPSYIKIGQDENKVKEFLNKVFYVEDLDSNKFYKNIVRNNIVKIVENTSGDNDSDGVKNLDFVAYLDENYKLIFEIEKDADKFGSFIVIGDTDNDGFYDIKPNASYKYSYDQELHQILDSEWFPSDLVHMTTSKYGNSKAILAINIKNYDFAGFFKDVISKELSSINDTIKSKETSIAFHNFIIKRLTDLTDKQKKVMKGAKVYLYGHDEACDSSEGHHILSKSARELSTMGLVEFSDLDIIDPDYHVEDNEDYWKNCLCNTQFTVTDFILWLNDNTDTFYSTIVDKTNNINFWRWVKGCKLSNQTLTNLPTLPIYLTPKGYATSDEIIYLSDNYISDGGLETIVKYYHPEASFISSDYIFDDEDIDAWKEFWVKIGVRFEMVDILIDTIDNRLSETEDVKLPSTIVKYRMKLEEHYGGDLISHLSDLRVKAGKEFYNLSEIIYVDCEKDEPFSFISLPKQANLSTADERKLIIEILNKIGGTKITKLTDWQQAKINRYLEIQADENQIELLRSIHYPFINELASMYTEDKDTLKDFKNINEILFIDTADEFARVSELTEGSIYNPFCDFEKYGLDYHYISNLYDTKCENDIRKMLNKVFKIHCDFEKADIAKLSNRNFAIYFWSQYLLKRDADINGVKKLIEEREFDNVACIPTKNHMKKPGELYSPSITSYVKQHIVDWENKLPLEYLPNIEYHKEDNRTLFDLLLNKPSNLRLSFCDSLYALFSIVGQKRRVQLLKWMIETYEEKYDINIDEYRADKGAVWKNTKNIDKSITELYALSANDKRLEQYFGNLPQIINKEYFPEETTSFRSACDMLKITTIESKQLIIDPIDKDSEYDFYKKDMRLYKKDMRIFALVLAGFEDIENWSTRYQNYCNLIDKLELWCCSAISIRYKNDETICQKLKKFYYEKGRPDFYFVKSLYEIRVFKPYVESFIEYLGIEADKDLVETIMESTETALEYVQENNTLMLDEAFKDELDFLIPGIKRELIGIEADEEDVHFDDKPHTHISHWNEPADEQNDVTSENTLEPKQIRKELNESYNFHTETKHGNETQVSQVAKINSQTADKPKKNTYVGDDHTQFAFDTSKVPQRRRPKDYDDWRPMPHQIGKEDIEKYNPANHSTRDIVGWKKDTPQAELGVAEVTSDEAAAITHLIGGTKTLDEIIDENLVARYRMYHALKNKGFTPTEELSQFIKNRHHDNHGVQTNHGYIHTRSAKGGILFVSGMLWDSLVNRGGRICMYYGNKAYDFEIIDSVDKLIKFVGRDNIIIQVSGEDKEQIINSVFSGQVDTHKAHILIRIKSNSRYNSIFEMAYNSDNDNDTSIY